jgi:excisionase family DNA binding protein
MIVDPQVARDLIGLRRFVVAAARRHRVDDDPTIRRAVMALDSLERALRSADYGGISADLPHRPGGDWIGTDEAAARLGISERAVRYRIGSGRLRAARDRRGAWRIDPATIGG